MKMSLSLSATLQQTLTPQQIQYLKLLQLPILQLEQHIRQEIEENPMLEEIGEYEDQQDFSENEYEAPATTETVKYEFEGESYNSEVDYYSNESFDSVENPDSQQLFNESPSDPFEFYEVAWQENSANDGNNDYSDEDENGYGFQIKENKSFFDELLDQFRLLELTKLERIIGEIIIGNLDDDGYLRRDLAELLEEINDEIIEINHELIKIDKRKEEDESDFTHGNSNPALQYALDSNFKSSADLFKKNGQITTHATNNLLPLVTKEDIEGVLSKIRQLDPPGVGSRNIQECLLAQLELEDNNEDCTNAIRVLKETYDSFAMKHYHVIMRTLNISEEELKSAIEVIRKLNPRPGYGDSLGMTSTVIPDYSIEYDEKLDDIVISINDNRIPELRVNKMYERLKRDARVNKFNKDTKVWLRKKFDDAKFLLQAIQQRKITMLKVMTGIAGLQKDFFKIGPEGLRPLIYKDVADDTGLDVSTICRIVNGKFAQTPYGTFELRYFFSESLPSDDGEEISTRIVKQRIKELVESETKGKPMSDEKLTKELKKIGLNIARRTVAKYREQLRIPVARLRKEL